MSSQLPASTDTIDAAAAQWIARRDRGLSAAEQDDYMAWLRADPRHAAAIARHAAVLERMMGLGAWQPELSAEPNPDLFAPPARRPWRVLAPVLALAAALVLGLFVWQSASPRASVPQKTFLRVNERQALADGSVVELKDGSRLDVRFTSGERRVRLTGEAHFTVAKNPARPFIVEAHGVEVRAVGTAFNVRVDAAAVEVLVTEGKVRVTEPVSTLSAQLLTSNTPAQPQTFLTAGQQVVVPLAASAPAPVVATVSEAQIRTTLEWQTPRLQFFETPLAEAVAEFNRHNPNPLVLADAALGSVPIGGTFRVDNVEGFVRLLELTVDVRSEPRADGAVVLKRAR
ncbi:MAG: FecR domain-containing protein [Verrucomicrobia bacterium]|nr:FecR domain-containing protein [Verrucomicrobiota bacterium]